MSNIVISTYVICLSFSMNVLNVIS